MAVPTFISVTPGTGPTRGRKLVQIRGTNFQLPPSPPAQGKTVPLNPSVRVLFGATPAVNVDVLTTGLLNVTTPVQDPGIYDVTIQNIDQTGAVVGSEHVTASQVFTAAQPALAAPGPVAESLLAYVVRTLLRQMKQQILDNVELTVHTDYDDTTTDVANIAMLAKLPGLVLAGPKLRPNRFYTNNDLRPSSDQFSQATQQRPGYTVDVVFTVIGVWDAAQPALNLLHEVISFFNQNINLTVVNPTDPSNAVDFEMKIEDPMSAVGGPSNSNIHAFSGTVAIVGVTLDDIDMAIREVFDVDNVLLDGDLQQIPPEE